MICFLILIDQIRIVIFFCNQILQNINLKMSTVKMFVSCVSLKTCIFTIIYLCSGDIITNEK